MSEGGYTFTTISADDGAVIRINTSFHLDNRSDFQVYGVGGASVHLGVEHGDVSVRLAPRSREQVTADDVQIARRLVQAATTYLAELERLNAEHCDQADTAA